MEQTQTHVHWADFTADRIIQQKGNKDTYVLASGITPSGVVHFGNFREVITVDFVARALRAKGKKVRFIFSWDDYDTFRKVPANMPKQEELQKFLFQPIVDTPDPFGEHDSYAAHHEAAFESQLNKMGITVEPLYQAKKYRSGEYKNEIIKTLKHTDTIKAILNQHRAESLEEGWLPVSIYCEKCNRDKIKTIQFDGEHKLSYQCELCQHQGTENILTSSRIKLPWRMDWPMRWAYEKVDFEPGGKDHSSQGGSYTTAKDIVRQVYSHETPVYLQYDFVSIKGAGGKMSSSSGNLVTVNDVLKIYEPEMIRWIFASYKSNIDFALSFDLDVIKNYEDYDRMERVAYGLEEANDKKKAMAKRVLELSQITEMPDKLPFQPSFRHLCNILQIFDKNIENAKICYKNEIQNSRDERRYFERSERALFWLENYAPEEFIFQLNKKPIQLELQQNQKTFISELKKILQNNWADFTSDKVLHEKMYELLHLYELNPQEAFSPVYKILMNKEKGPKLASFILTIGKDKILPLLSHY